MHSGGRIMIMLTKDGWDDVRRLARILKDQNTLYMDADRRAYTTTQEIHSCHPNTMRGEWNTFNSVEIVSFEGYASNWIESLIDLRDYRDE
jgi:hypothetical protein